MGPYLYFSSTCFTRESLHSAATLLLEFSGLKCTLILLTEFWVLYLNHGTLKEPRLRSFCANFTNTVIFVFRGIPVYTFRQQDLNFVDNVCTYCTWRTSLLQKTSEFNCYNHVTPIYQLCNNILVNTTFRTLFSIGDSTFPIDGNFS